MQRDEGPVPHISGYITVVQESRFRLSTLDGRSILFLLDRRASIEPQDLPALLSPRRVRVDFAEAPKRKALAALDVRAEAAA
ncbi:hypothetical protein [Roseitranquillus sediminis]|uniref:hypothetical protein n=1 Tax=Roseitranquillus sediminis TaxID=2809051 RepID=UPI001D0CA2A4|nr:hypothetical protein [Roseitranquillus sediminis]MBM9593389.1 hypothetical protein [Roseitranquillus sediminis]